MNTCGSAIDLLRSCYQTTMRFFYDSDLEIPVQWYFCDSDAQILPFWTRFASGNWASDKIEWTGPGEASWRPRPWVNGAFPQPYPVTFWDFTGQSAALGAVNSVTSAYQMGMHPGDTVLVWVLSYVGFGGGPLGSITDFVGNVFALDYWAKGTTDPNIQIQVWRARPTVSTAFGPFTLHFPGTTQSLTFGVLVYRGLKDQAPIQVLGKDTPAGSSPSVGPITEDHYSRLCLALFATQSWTGPYAGLPGFQARDGIATGGVEVDGQVSDQIGYSKFKAATFTWPPSVFAESLSVLLVYEGEPLSLPPGNSFCGSQEVWTNGASINDPVPIADPFGNSPCCGGGRAFYWECLDWLLWIANVGYSNVQCRVTAGWIGGVPDPTYVGVVLPLFWEPPFIVTDPNFSFLLGPQFNVFTFICNGGVPTCQNDQHAPSSAVKGTLQGYPPVAVFQGIYAYWFNPTAGPQLDLVVELVP